MAITYDEEAEALVGGYDDDLDEFETDAIYDVNIKVFGVGGGGGNALEHMAKIGVKGVEYIAVNTDVAALKTKDKNVMRRVQIGKKCTRGRGAGGRPEIAAESANENKDEIQNALKGATMVFIAAGMGGGTGTGAAPIIAQIAKDMGILTVGVVTKPFDFERSQKMNQALKGIAEMRKYVDALIIVPNQRLLKLNERAINFKAAFELVDDVLYRTVKSISELVNSPAAINIDFADLKSTLENAGDAHIAIGTGTGDNKVDDAVQQVINSPLLETSINNAGKVLVNITMSEDILLQDVDEVMNRITSAASADVEVIHGVAYDSELKDTIIVTIIATCFDTSAASAPQPEVNDGQVLASVSAPTSTQQSRNDEIITTSTRSQSLDALITSTLDITSGDDDGYSELEKIFKSRK